MNKKTNSINKLDALSKLELQDKSEYKEYISKLDSCDSDYLNLLSKSHIAHKNKLKKDEWFHGVKRFKTGDLVRATSNHPGWGDYKDRLLGGIVLDTDGEAPSWGTWSRPFYKVLWPYGLVEDVPDDWISEC